MPAAHLQQKRPDPSSNIAFLLNGGADPDAMFKNRQDPIKIRGHYIVEQMDTSTYNAATTPSSDDSDSQYADSVGGSGGGGADKHRMTTRAHQHLRSHQAIVTDDMDLSHVSAEERRRYRNRISKRASRNRKTRAVGTSPQSPQQEARLQDLAYLQSIPILPLQLYQQQPAYHIISPITVDAELRLEWMEQRIEELEFENQGLRNRITNNNNLALLYNPNVSHMPLLQRAVFGSMNQTSANLGHQKFC
ncbi:UNVERIFIED_CONTAM: hypothetical protein HDU68_005767 [Siphonaria sp. JEL0065]|nr:hypothetical protein HDU68_005767 [Siphonaria sp. JEL0065]